MPNLNPRTLDVLLDLLGSGSSKVTIPSSTSHWMEQLNVPESKCLPTSLCCYGEYSHDEIVINRRPRMRGQAVAGIWACFCGCGFRLWSGIGLELQDCRVREAQYHLSFSNVVSIKCGWGWMELFIKHRSTSQMSWNHIFQITLLAFKNRNLPSISNVQASNLQYSSLTNVCVHTFPTSSKMLAVELLYY